MEDNLDADLIRHRSSAIFFQEGKTAGLSSLNAADDEAPEDAIPDLPENQAARQFLKNAPRKGLHMPLGKDVKVMQCWRCKAYGHRTGDRECPMRLSGNIVVETQRQLREDPMSQYQRQQQPQQPQQPQRQPQQQQPQQQYQYVHDGESADSVGMRRLEKYRRVEHLMALVAEIRNEEAVRRQYKREKRKKRGRSEKNGNRREKERRERSCG